jgi:transcription elongation factor GreA
MPIPGLPSADPEEQRVSTQQPVPRLILTPDGEQAIRAEVQRLREKAHGEFATRLRDARDFGGTRENDEYLQIKEEEAVLASRIHRLESLLELAEVVEQEPGAADTVAIGSVVEVKSLGSGRVREHRLAGGFGLDDSDDISVNSPVGQALLGRSPGERVAVELPNGRLARLEVLSVRPDRATARPVPA